MKTQKFTPNTADKLLSQASLTIVNLQLQSVDIQLDNIDRQKTKLLTQAKKSPSGRLSKKQREFFDKLAEKERKAELRKDELLTEKFYLNAMLRPPEQDALDQIKAVRNKTKGINKEHKKDEPDYPDR